MKISFLAAVLLLAAVFAPLTAAMPVKGPDGKPVGHPISDRPIPIEWNHSAAACANYSLTPPAALAARDSPIWDSDKPLNMPGHNVRVVMYGFSSRYHVDYISLDVGDGFGEEFEKQYLCQCHLEWWDYQYHQTDKVGYQIKYTGRHDLDTPTHPDVECLDLMLKYALNVQTVDWVYDM